jgi:chromosome segregation ATPase
VDLLDLLDLLDIDCIQWITVLHMFDDDLGSRLSGSKYAKTPALSVQHLSSSPSHLKDDLEDKHRLERQNFDLKLKVFHLEESIKKMQEAEFKHQVSNGTARSEVYDLKLQLEEKEIELEQRNLLLMKAKAAIETMKNELDRSKSEIAKQLDLEDRIKRLKQMNDEIELDYKAQLMKLEAEVNAMRQAMSFKEQERSMLEEKLVRGEQLQSALN